MPDRTTLLKWLQLKFIFTAQKKRNMKLLFCRLEVNHKSLGSSFPRRGPGTISTFAAGKYKRQHTPS